MHHIRPLEFDSMESLKGTVNWEEYWLNQGGAGKEGVERLVRKMGIEEVEEGDGEGKGKVEVKGVESGVGKGTSTSESREEKEERIKNVLARRRFVESSEGWERGRRVSLTVRKVKKVWQGFRLGGA